ncbi:MAG: NADH-quinone oxidoreductase subunit J [Proteobacteria bacterium]|nr:NADH-quinone oxidoreductase subunit J [Pseudomonadota bacterium]
MLVELVMLLLFRMKTDLPQDELIRHAQGHSNIAELGESLFTHYVYPFEIAGVILLVSIVAAIMLTHRKRPGNKHIDVSRQINVNPAERMRMVKMKTEKGNGEEQ